MVPRALRHALALVLIVIAALSAGRRGPRSFAPLPEPPPPEPTLAMLDPNRATPAQLETLPGIGTTLAARIVEARSRRRFERVDDLARVRGIGDRTLARVRGRLRVEPDAGSEVAEEGHPRRGGEEVRRELATDERERVRRLE